MTLQEGEQNPAVAQEAPKEEVVTFEDFDVIKVIGRGGFGKVRM